MSLKLDWVTSQFNYANYLSNERPAFLYQPIDCVEKKHSPFNRPTLILAKPDDVSKVAKIRNRYNQVPHLTQDTSSRFLAFRALNWWVASDIWLVPFNSRAYVVTELIV